MHVTYKDAAYASGECYVHCSDGCLCSQMLKFIEYLQGRCYHDNGYTVYWQRLCQNYGGESYEAR